MNIEELSNKLYDDLNGVITLIDNTNDSLIIYLECDDWNNFDILRKFKIVCHNVVDIEIQPSPTGEIEFIDSDPLLWDYNEPHGSLFYSSKSNNRYEILGKIWEAHQKVFSDWKPLTKYANIYRQGEILEFCKDNKGQLASGPKPLLDRYKKALDDKIKINYVQSYKPEGGYRLLAFDSGYVVCKNVEVTEINS